MIPIENVYYLFCYAWNRFEEAKAIPLGSSPSPDLPNLLARVLLTGTRQLLRRRLDCDYQDRVEAIATVRGRIELGETIQLQARSIRRLFCEFDDLSHDLLHNQVIKASLRRLARAQSIDPGLARDLIRTSQRMPGVSDIHLNRPTFSCIRLHRNNAYYVLILKVAKLAFDCLLPDENGDKLAFHDVLRDETKMARVFETFVRNFYGVEQQAISMVPLTIAWDAKAIRRTGAGRLPSMIADIYLKNDHRRLMVTQNIMPARSNVAGKAARVSNRGIFIKFLPISKTRLQMFRSRVVRACFSIR